MPKSVAGTAADPVVVFTPLEIDGETYSLAYDFNAIAEAEKLCGANLLRGIMNPVDMTAVQLRGLLYAAMRKAHPKITVEQVGDLLGKGVRVMAKAQMALFDAYGASVENPPEGGSASPPPPEG